ncbi:MAG: hypothetical protein F4Y82_05005 [Cenarchaeum sp. SB0665_bin_23]|nr:hypothetical protein [Cenarchaeum sp. SB0665_bin_23]MYB46414.1 hypothetical protein [Cenarchaeum sp. SB0662_bin_33]MYG33474.1 hypothetical protein [Cenarchaeum sp. SB0677_bin_16]
MNVRCSLCGMIFDDTDKLIRQRKHKHEKWHHASILYRRNVIIGDVIWIDDGTFNGISKKMKK